jgi:hypothetical protein
LSFKSCCLQDPGTDDKYDDDESNDIGDEGKNTSNDGDGEVICQQSKFIGAGSIRAPF